MPRARVSLVVWRLGSFSNTHHAGNCRVDRRVGLGWEVLLHAPCWKLFDRLAGGESFLHAPCWNLFVGLGVCLLFTPYWNLSGC